MTIPLVRTFTDPARELLRGFELDVLENSTSLGYLIDDRLRLVYVNKQFQLNAEANGAPDLIDRFPHGSLLLEAISGPQKQYFEKLYRNALKSKEPLKVDYDCPTQSRHQEFRMILYPLNSGRGVYAEHSLVVSRDLNREAIPFNPDWFLDKDRLAHQCGHCRRTLNVTTGTWEWVPDLFGHNQVSHGLCPTCLNYHYPDY